MLIGGLDVEIRREAKLGALAHDGFVTQTRVHPNVERIVAAGRASG